MPFENALPSPSLMQPGGPILGALNAINQNQILGAQAQYAPQQAAANAFLTTQQAQWLPYQYKMQALSNPLLWMAAEKNPALQAQLNRMISNPLQDLSIGSSNLPPEFQPNNSLLGQIVQKVRGAITQQSQPEQAPVNNLMVPPLGNQSANVPGAPASNVGIPAAPSAPSVPPSPLSPNNIYQQMEAGNAAASGEGKSISEQWKERQDDIRTQVTGAQEMKNQLDKLIDARGRLTRAEKGPILGNLPAISTAAQDSDIALSNLVAARLRAWQSNRITNMDIGFGKMLKAGRYMNDPAFYNEVNYEKGLAARTQEYPAFAQRAKIMNLTPSQADAIWARYANERPFYDPKNKEVLTDNLQSWEDYLKPESIGETFSPQFRKQMDQYRKNMAGGDEATDKKVEKNYNEFQNQFSPEKLKNSPEAQKEGIAKVDLSKNKKSAQGFDASKFLDNKFQDANEFREAFNTLNADAKEKVKSEMKRRGWH